MANIKLKKIPVSEPSKDEKKFMDEMEGHPSSRLPSFDVDDKQMPEIKNWEQGESYILIVKVNMRMKRSDKRGTNADLDIVSYKSIVKKKIDDMTDEEFGKEQSKRLSRKK